MDDWTLSPAGAASVGDDASGDSQAGDHNAPTALQLAQATPEAEAIGEVTAADGVAWRSGAAGDRAALEEGSPVFQGDLIETLSGSELEITFLDGTKFSLADDAKMVLNELIYDPNTGIGSFVASMIEGTIGFVSGDVALSGNDAMQLETPGGTIGIRGTRVACSLSAGGGGTACSNLPHEDGTLGVWVFRNDEGEVVVSELFDTVLSGGPTAPLTTQVLTLQQIQLLYRSLVSDLFGDVDPTEAGEEVQGGGGTFFFFDPSGILEGLIGESVIGQVGMTLTPGLDAVDKEPIPIPRTPGPTASVVDEERPDGEPTLINGLLGPFPSDGTAVISGSVILVDGQPIALTSGGLPVTLTLSADGLSLTGSIFGADGSETLVFNLLFNGNTGEYSFRLFRALDHMKPGLAGEDDVIDIVAAVTVTIEDPDPRLGDGPLFLFTTITVSVQDSMPTVVDDVLQVVPEGGDESPNVIGGNLVTNDAGGADLPAGVLSFSYDGGTKTAAGGSTVTTALGGILTVNNDGSWSYQAPANVQGDSFDSFTYLYGDFDGDTGTGSQPILVLDDPTANVQNVDDVEADLEANLAGGSNAGQGDVQISDSLGIDFGNDQNLVQISSLTLKALNPDEENGGSNEIALTDLTSGGQSLEFVETTGSRILTANVAGNPGQIVFRMTVEEDGNFLFELFLPLDHPDIGQFGEDDILALVFTFTATDGVDSATGTITIRLSDDGPTLFNVVNQVSESALANGSGGGSAFVTGNLHSDGTDDIFGADGGSITNVTAAGGTTVIGNGGNGVASGFIQVTTAAGVLLVNAATGAYSYQLTDNTSGDNTSDIFTYVFTDGDGDSRSATLTVAIVDDQPTAVADSDSVAEGASTSGNVIAGAGGGTDVTGADGVVVVGVAAGAAGPTAPSGQVGSGVVGSFGTLTVTSDGTYSYQSDPDKVPDGESVIDTFTYAIQDGDGDISFTEIVITVNDTPVPVNEEPISVDEANLAGGSAASPPVSDSGILPVPAGGSVLFVTLQGGDPVTTTLNGSTLTLSDDAGRWTLVVDTAAGAYSFELLAAFDHGTSDSLDLVFDYTLEDALGNTNGDIIRVTLSDDMPTANDDSDTAAEGLGAVLGNVLDGTGTNEQASGSDDDVPGADGAALLRSVTHDGVTYSLNDATGLYEASDGSSDFSYSAATGILSIATASGGSFDILVTAGSGDSDLSSLGDYRYTPPSELTAGASATETFGYVLEDGDGDGDPATLTIRLAGGDFTLAPTPGFEDGLANLSSLPAGSAEGPIALNLSFAPDETTALVSVKISGIPSDGTLFLGDQALTPDGNGDYIVQAADIGNLFYMPAAQDDGDVTLTLEATVTRDGQTFTLNAETFDAAGEIIVVDAVADAARNLSILVLNDDPNSPKDFKVSETGTARTQATFDDTDGSEDHTLRVTIPVGFLVLFMGDGNGGFILLNADGSSITLPTGVTVISVTNPLDGSDGEIVFDFDASLAGSGAFDVTFAIQAAADLTDAGDTFNLTATSEETNGNLDPTAGDAEVTTGNNSASVSAIDRVDTDIIIAVNAQIITNSNSADAQFLEMVIAGPMDDILSSIQVPLQDTGQQSNTLFELNGGQPIELDADLSYAVSLKFSQGTQTFNLTDFNLQDAAGNIIITFPISGNIQISDGQGSGSLGAIWQMNGNGDFFDLPEAILFEIADGDGNAENEVALDSDGPGLDFILDFSLLTLEDDAATTMVNEAMFADTRSGIEDVELLDISGGNGEHNTIANLSARDVLELTDSGNILHINGDSQGQDADTVNVLNTGEWAAAGTTTVDIGGAGSLTYDVFTAMVDGQTVTLRIEDELTTNLVP